MMSLGSEGAWTVAQFIKEVFLPLPFLADEDPDAPVPTLFDHILSISAAALQAFSGRGALLIMTRDVLPCFSASELAIPEDGVCSYCTMFTRSSL
ncbi:hypothetical protein R1sor_026620 [Riccia sorocarpa]|uniref:Uncharacterized protein n=1 Tax=Riccia sorocarpa TaxID=122646 RepID=A0ABD3GES0_9MARC